MTPPPPLVAAAALAGIPHGFFGRQGGVSTGIFATLNTGLGSGDDPAAVRQNRARAVAAIAPGAALASLHQVHGTDVVHVTAAIAEAERPRADALVTATPGLALGILTADCAPVLLADAAAGVIGAAHAGWKGALHDILEPTVAAMVALGAARERIAAAIGPAIARASYEVDTSFRERFRAADPTHDGFFTPGREDRFQFDLEGLVALRLATAGVRSVTALGLDTYRDEARWFSYRRATHRGERDYGRQLSLICLPRPGFAQEPGA